jgi:hypothetical protein
MHTGTGLPRLTDHAFSAAAGWLEVRIEKGHMTGTTILSMLFGAALVAIGVLAAALADRIRGIRAQRDRTATATVPRNLAPRGARQPIEVIEPEPVPTPAKPERARGARVVPPVERLAADDVIAALVGAGYKKPIATEATWGCSAIERVTIEAWTRAALRAAAKGGQS